MWTGGKLLKGLWLLPSCEKIWFLNKYSKYEVTPLSRKPHRKIRAQMIMLLTVKSARRFNKVSHKTEFINQLFTFSLLVSERNYCTAQTFDKTRLFFLTITQHLFLQLAHKPTHSEMLFLISPVLLEYSPGKFFSSLIEFDNFTTRCWREDHLLINLGHSQISILLLLVCDALLSTHTLLSKTIPNNIQKTAAGFSLVS